MKKLFFSALLAICSICLFTGCIKDSYRKTTVYTYYVPVYKTTQEVRENIRSNPAKAIEKPGKLFIRGNFIFLNDVDRGIHVIDNSNPAAPKNVAFIDIPGNLDMAVKGTTLYADLYTDLVTLDISNPLNVSVKKIQESVFPHRYYNGMFVPDPTKIIAEWQKKDTTITEKGDLDQLLNRRDIFILYSAVGNSLATGAPSAAAYPVGTGGSMARFTIVNERLYTVGTNDLKVFNISNPAQPSMITSKNIGWNIETIFPFKENLFIGSANGMFIFNINNPDNPTQTGSFSHVQSCDPVIADDEYAYVTLRSGTRCQGSTNQLDILKLNNLTDPNLVKTYTLNNPHGLSKDGNLLFICDGSEGLKIYNSTDVQNLQLIRQIPGIKTYDVIAMGGIALVVAEDGLYQYDYTNLNQVRLLSRLGITR